MNKVFEFERKRKEEWSVKKFIEPTCDVLHFMDIVATDIHESTGVVVPGDGGEGWD